jgi:hypothetical protein
MAGGIIEAEEFREEIEKKVVEAKRPKRGGPRK